MTAESPRAAAVTCGNRCQQPLPLKSVRSGLIPTALSWAPSVLSAGSHPSGMNPRCSMKLLWFRPAHWLSSPLKQAL